MYKWNLCNSF